LLIHARQNEHNISRIVVSELWLRVAIARIGFLVPRCELDRCGYNVHLFEFVLMDAAILHGGIDVPLALGMGNDFSVLADSDNTRAFLKVCGKTATQTAYQRA
jgi:hypothetical protein